MPELGVLQTLILCVLGLSLLIFIALFGHVPSLRRTPIGWAHRFMWKTLPRWITALDRLISGGRILSGLFRCGSFCIGEKHPTVLIFYLLLITGGLYLFLISAWSQLWSPIHKFFVPIVSVLPYVTLYLAAYSDPGYVTKKSFPRAIRAYPFDNVNFHAGNVCRTCRLRKPARSKHCSICKHCISRHDHHCVWINNCVGHSNTRYFLLFLWCTSVFLFYGSYLSWVILGQRNKQWIPAGKTMSMLDWGDWSGVWATSILEETYLGVVFLLAALCSPLPFAFMLYHIYLVWAGTTTNETVKWSDWKDDISDGDIYMSEATSDAEFAYFEDIIRRQQQNDFDRGVLEESTGSAEQNNTSPQPPQPRSDHSWHAQERSEFVPWPRKQRQILARITNEFPVSHLPKELKWRQVKSISEVDNIYDVGFKGNFAQVLWPKRL